jgi:phage tail-like protein
MLSNDDRESDYEIGDLERFISALQDIVDMLLWDVDYVPRIWDIDKSPAVWLPALLADLGNPFSFDLTENKERKLAAILIEIYKQKGTEVGIINVVRFFMGIEITDISSYNQSCWLLGEHELGVDTYFGPGNKAALYTFEVTVSQTLTAEQERQMSILIDYMKPAHTHYIIIQPASPVFIDHWSLGESRIGESTYLH